MFYNLYSGVLIISSLLVVHNKIHFWINVNKGGKTVIIVIFYPNLWLILYFFPTQKNINNVTMCGAILLKNSLKLIGSINVIPWEIARPSPTPNSPLNFYDIIKTDANIYWILFGTSNNFHRNRPCSTLIPNFWLVGMYCSFSVLAECK